MSRSKSVSGGTTDDRRPSSGSRRDIRHGSLTHFMVEAEMILFMSGATMWEWQIGRLYGGFLKPKYWCRRNLTHMVMIRWDNEEPL